MKTIRCLTRTPITDDGTKWNYAWKEFCEVTTEYTFRIQTHHIHSFLSLHAHLTAEDHLESLTNLLLKQFPFKKLLLPYDIIHGVLCGYYIRKT